MIKLEAEFIHIWRLFSVSMGCTYVHIGGTENHIHILFDIGKTTLTTKIIAKIKKDTSKFIKTTNNDYQEFYWQSGYGIFSISPASKDDVIKYIDNQVEHHKEMSFKEEIYAYLKKYNIPYDEKYIWD